jgi:hypothetical protein
MKPRLLLEVITHQAHKKRVWNAVNQLRSTTYESKSSSPQDPHYRYKSSNHSRHDILHLCVPHENRDIDMSHGVSIQYSFVVHPLESARPNNMDWPDRKPSVLDIHVMSTHFYSCRHLLGLQVQRFVEQQQVSLKWITQGLSNSGRKRSKLSLSSNPAITI